VFLPLRWILCTLLAGSCCLYAGLVVGTEETEPAADVVWKTDYAESVGLAKDGEKMLLIFFCNSEKDKSCAKFENETLADPSVREKLKDYVLLRLPLDAKIKIDDKEVELLKRPMFKEMLERPGIAIVDYVHKDESYYGDAVSTFPLTNKLSYTAKQMAAILDLPEGTLTQRTLIYAVRVHPEHPASAEGKPDTYLLQEAEGHSKYQASICVQGHHNWGTRFQRIISRFRGGLTASEVCAESWAGENLVEAAIECVRCWRTSSGHWSSVRASNSYFGYDMKRGKNGVWYATGIFGRKG
jgi:hypothetical protein